MKSSMLLHEIFRYKIYRSLFPNICLQTTSSFVGWRPLAVVPDVIPYVISLYMFMEPSEKLVLDMAEQKPSLWLWYMDDTSVIWPNGLDNLQDFFHHISSLRPTIKFTMEIKTDGAVLFLDVLSRRDLHWTPKYTENPHTMAITSISNGILHHMWREELCRVYTTVLLPYAKSNKTALMKLIFLNMTYSLVPVPLDLLIQLSTGQKEVFIWRMRLNHLVCYLCNMWGVFLKSFKSLVSRYNIKTVFKMRGTLRNSLMRTKLIRAPQEMANCVCSIPCECGRSYIGETGRPLPARLSEHRQNLVEGHLETSILAHMPLKRIIV